MDVLKFGGLCAAFIIIARNKQRNKRKCWIREFLKKKHSYSFIEKMLLDGGWFFQNFTRMSSTDFEELLSMVGPIIRKTNTNMREAIPEKVRLAVCLRYLASGDSYRSLMYTFKISDSTISLIIPEVCNALNQVLKGYVKVRRLMYFQSRKNNFIRETQYTNYFNI